MILKLRLKQHITENRWQYILITVIFLIGLVLGNYKALGLEGGVKSHLLALIDNYLQGGISGSLNGNGIFLSAFYNQAKTVIAIWFLGLTVIGFPLILAVIFLRGFSFGFTVGFLLQEKAGIGILISIISILPQNLVYIPCLIMVAVLAMNFSIYIIKRRNNKMMPLSTGLITYSLLMLFCMCIFLAGAFIEAYLSSWFLKLVL